VVRYMRLSWLAIALVASGGDALRVTPERFLNRRAAIEVGAAAAASLGVGPSCATQATAAVAKNPLCDSSITTVKSATGQEITLIGTAHISEDSALLVRDAIRYVQPDTVMVELDPSRAGKLMQRSKGVIAADQSAMEKSGGGRSGSGNPTYGIGQLAGRLLRGDLAGAAENGVGLGLSSLYKQMDTMGFQSGGEFLAAVEEADAIGATLLLGDRDARVTIQRLRDAMFEVLKNPPEPTGATLPPALLAAAGGADVELKEMTKESVENTLSVMKQRQNVRELTAYIKSEVPPLYRALIGERDEYMAKSLLGSAGARIVAVVGLAHVDGIEETILKAGGQRGSAATGCRA